ncbi:DUF2235 domain-containing protein [Chitinophagaceae bacterium 26-R-25]|nr:DUF2235 domain-containing protein [Chitinophagaceae bacterium 26-R-25]
MASIVFGNYTPPEDNNNDKDKVFGIFFDGTKNNKTNTEEREKNTAAFQKYGKEEKGSSYYNEWSNVARLWKCYDEKLAIYVEGIGTEDRKADDEDGSGWGAGVTGIRGKVRKGCELIVGKIKGNTSRAIGEITTIDSLTLDVFGFSRGAAAARNFLHEIQKAKYKALGDVYNHYVDADNQSVSQVDLPPHGHLGLMMQKLGVEIGEIKVRFLGIFDTVSSYDKLKGIPPDFSNDVEELHLNDIESAKTIVHFTAKDEIRKYFALTHVYGSIEKEFPGVHSDIGGSYPDKMDEVVYEIETESVLRSTASLENVRQRLIEEGWYTADQLQVIPGRWAYHNLRGSRTGSRCIRNTYSFIPLQFMAEYAINKELPLGIEKLKTKYSISNDALLVRAMETLRPYVMGNGKPYTFKWYSDIQKTYRHPHVPPYLVEAYNKELKEQEDLRKLRNRYFHWSADRSGIGVLAPTSDWKRKEY